MTRLLLAVLLLASLACSTLPVKPTAAVNTVTHITTTPTASPRVTVTGNVWIRNAAGANTGYWLNRGSEIAAECDGNYCYIVGSSGHFWRGCSSDNAGLGCR